jgi:hypothetical protein
MKMTSLKANPAFKLTQVLPLLPADFRARAGRAARTFATNAPPSNVWSPSRLNPVADIIVASLQLQAPGAACRTEG